MIICIRPGSDFFVINLYKWRMAKKRDILSNCNTNAILMRFWKLSRSFWHIVDWFLYIWHWNGFPFWHWNGFLQIDDYLVAVLWFSCICMAFLHLHGFWQLYASCSYMAFWQLNGFLQLYGFLAVIWLSAVKWFLCIWVVFLQVNGFLPDTRLSCSFMAWSPIKTNINP